MATGKVTKRSVDELTGEGAETFLWDEELKGFGLKVTKSGAKSYVYQFRLGGREARTRRYTIGGHGSPWTPATARREAERLAIMVAQGVDPAEEAVKRRREAVDLAFSAYASKFHAACSGKGWRSLIERTIRLHLTPAFKDKPINAIRRHHVAAMLDRIPMEQVALRRNTFAVARRLFRWATARGDIDRSPCEGMDTPPAVRPRERVLSDAELTHVWNASFEAGHLFGPIVRLLIATGQRREEVTGLSWSELDQTTRLWQLPAERSKNGTGHIVPLNEAAVSVLDQQAGATKWPVNGLIFPTSGGRQFNAHAKGKTRLDNSIEVHGTLPHWRLHDLRRTVATGFQRLGVRFEVTEAVLNHLSGSRAGVAGVYQRHDWQQEKAEALAAWSDHLALMLSKHDDPLSERDRVLADNRFATAGQPHIADSDGGPR